MNSTISLLLFASELLLGFVLFPELLASFASELLLPLHRPEVPRSRFELVEAEPVVVGLRRGLVRGRLWSSQAACARGA